MAVPFFRQQKWGGYTFLKNSWRRLKLVEIPKPDDDDLLFFGRDLLVLETLPFAGKTQIYICLNPIQHN